MRLALLNQIMQFLPWQTGHRGEFVRNFLLQVYFTFVQSAFMVTALGLAAGVAIAFQTNIGLSLFGNNAQFGKIFVFIIFREMAPLATALLIIARSATAMASEMATIKVQQEVEALRIMGISVYHYLLAPRIAAAMVSLFCMAMAFLMAAVLGGWLGANFTAQFPVSQYLNSLANAIRPADLLFFGLKTVIPGGVIAWAAVSRGLSLRSAPFEVPIVTNRAVVDCLTYTLMIHLGLTGLYYILFGLAL